LRRNQWEIIFFVYLDEKDLGCLVKISIDRIQFPIELVTQSDKDRISVFAQYRFYDKSIEKKFIFYIYFFSLSVHNN
jgi:hypothetical protein